MMKNYQSVFIYSVSAFIFVAFITTWTVESKQTELAELEATLTPVSKISSGYEEDYNFNPALDYFNSESAAIDLPQIKKRGKLIALTGYSPTGYFVYKGTPMGFEYDLLQLLAKDLNLELEIVIVKDMNIIIDMLNRGEGDLIADNLFITKEQDALVDFTLPLITTHQVLIQKKPDNWEKMTPDKLEEALIRNPINLIGKSVYVRRESAYYSRLKNLSEELGEDIKIIEEPGETETEELIKMVSEGKIPYTVTDANIAEMHAIYYSEIDVKTPISFDQRIAWAVREKSPLLKEKINAWIVKIQKKSTLNNIYNKYYTSNRRVDERIKCAKLSMCGRNISPYDKLIIKHSKEIGWDWRLLASLIYQESQFQPQAKSWAGATGLMQLMPATAASFGATNLEDPVESIKAGTAYLKWLDRYWKKKVPDPKERIKFIIASYNVGQEHVADAQRLAIKYEKNPCVWDDNVAYFIVQKSTQKYCTDPVVKHGYCRGKEPFEYVNNIFARYEHYKKLIKEEV